MIPVSLAPMVFAARTKGSSLKTRIRPLMTLAYSLHIVNPIAIMMLIGYGPMIATRTTANMTAGIASIISTKRITTISHHPPK